MLTSTKKKPLVGLDIEAGSIAATEVRQNGRAELAGFGVMALDAGVFREGEVADVEGLTEALKQLWSEQKLTKDIPLGIANQRVAVRTLRLPVIEDHDELDTAIRFQAQDQLPMPLDQSVLDWQTVGRTPVEDGSERLDVIAVAARRDMLGKMLDAVRGAGLRPRGFDLSAFGMVRALHTGKHASVTPGDFVTAPAPGAPSYEERIRGADAAVDSAPAYEPEPAEAAMVDVTPPASTATSAMSPTSPSPAARSASSPGSRPSGWRASRRSSPSGAASRSSTRASGSPMSASSGPSRRSTATPRRCGRPATASPRDRRGSSTSFAARSSTTRPWTPRYPWRAWSPAARARRSRASPSASSASWARGSRWGERGPSRTFPSPRRPA